MSFFLDFDKGNWLSLFLELEIHSRSIKSEGLYSPLLYDKISVTLRKRCDKEKYRSLFGGSSYQ